MKKLTLLKLIFSALLSGVLIYSCNYSVAEDKGVVINPIPEPIPEPNCVVPDSLTYEKYVSPTITANCSTCHQGDNGASPQIKTRRDFDAATDQIKFIINNPKEHKNSEAPFDIIDLGLTKCVVSNLNSWFEKGDQIIVVPPDPTKDPCRQNVTYSGNIKPVLDAKCNVCHGGEADNGAGIKLELYSDLINSVEDGSLYGSVSGDINFIQMPPGYHIDRGGEKYTDCEVTALDQWIKDGYPEN